MRLDKTPGSSEPLLLLGGCKCDDAKVHVSVFPDNE